MRHKHVEHSAQNQVIREPDENGTTDHHRPPNTVPMEEQSLNLSPKVVLFFVFMMCAMLMALYFLYDYLGKLVRLC